MVHDGPERRRPGYQHSGWALGQSREARRTFLVQDFLGTSFAIHCGLPVTTHFVATPAKSHLPYAGDALTTENRPR
jgi:hypothetical protein